MSRALPEPQLIEKYGTAVPRYTSYPTAVQFHSGIGPKEVVPWLQQAEGTASFYIHMAFCKTLCLYCGCNMKVTNQASTISAYVDAVLKEIDLATALIPRRLKVSTLHFGGGTPSYAPMEDLRRLFAKISAVADLTHGAEISMEIDPRRLADGLPPLLAELGINRASLGIQDTNTEVQRAIRREQPQSLNQRAARLLRAAGIKDICVDLLYGLPLQTVQTIQQTVDDVLALEPARVSLFGYAHVPWMKKHQAVLEQHGLPGQEERMMFFSAASERLQAAGYVAIGFDHFCLPNDPMSKAVQCGTLHRNFMGYTVDDASLLLGFGASAISQYREGYAQNLSSIPAYMAQVVKGELAIARGVRLSGDDVARRMLIERLLCDMAVAGHGLEKMVVKPEKLKGMVHDGLAEWRGDILAVTEKGRPFVRALASCFDGYHIENTRHSRI